MGTENSSSILGCPSKAKKSKKSITDDHNDFSQWHHLPAVVLHDIFDFLNKEDRKNATSVCKNWRQSAFHPKWWTKMTFNIEEENIQKTRFFTSTFGKIVASVTIKLFPLSHICMKEFVLLLRALNENNNLKELMIEPTHCRFEAPAKRIWCESNILDVAHLLEPYLPRLEKFSIGCVEDLSNSLGNLIKKLSPSKVTHLGLASVKDDPSFYRVASFDPDLITPFTKLKILSVDYDQITDNFLYNLAGSKHLERLVVHLHGVRQDHPGTTNSAWGNFHLVHPTCEFRLTVIHAFSDIKDLHNRVLRKQMPLTHLKVFFCESINIAVLEKLHTDYRKTLRSVMWIDSQSNNDSSWIFAKTPTYEDSPDPFILIAWLCKKLEEIVLFGYKYWEENLVAIGRLRGDKLQKLEIAEDDILFISEDFEMVDNNLDDIPKHMKKPWAPVKMSDLHPVICNPIEGDSDEYLLPIVLADLR